ncbi:MAG: hypothetical protein K2K97_10485 [Muribaculaceae bacterium]|nr:hypothetical protein [Muribaculaceae bacterium]
MAYLPKKEFQHQMGRRDRNHDYRSRRIYHITITKPPEVPYFSEVVGNPAKPEGSPDAPRAINNPLGAFIEQAIRHIDHQNPLLSIIDVIVMPDHVHFLLFVTQEIERHVGNEIAVLKVKCNKFLHSQYPQYGNLSVFNTKYVDVKISRDGQLDVEKEYLKNNPRRLLVMRKYPDFFKRNIFIKIDEERYIGFGNSFLLTKRFRYQVHVRSRWGEEEFEAHKKRCLEYCREGGIAVSPFYSPREKEILKEIIEAGGEVILVSMEAYSERTKPQGKKFDLCAAGRLLVVYEEGAPLYVPALKREVAVKMNGIAEKFCKAPTLHPRFQVPEK